MSGSNIAVVVVTAVVSVAVAIGALRVMRPISQGPRQPGLWTAMLAIGLATAGVGAVGVWWAATADTLSDDWAWIFGGASVLIITVGIVCVGIAAWIFEPSERVPTEAP